jgi:hypothetical protein
MSVQLNVYGVHDEVTGTLVLTVHDPNGQVAANGVKFYVTDATGLRSAAQDADRRPSPGVYEKDVLLSESNETLIEPEVTLTDGTKLTPGAESFPRTTGMAITLVHDGKTERGTSLEVKTGLAVDRTGDGRRPVIGASKSLLASAGQAGRGLREGDERSGLGGVPGALASTLPVRDSAGLDTLVDPATRKMGTGLLGPSGTSAGNMEDGSNRGRTGLTGTGVVNLGVPRGHAVANVPAISSADGQILDSVAVSGKAGVYPVATDDSVSALSDGATVTGNASRGNQAKTRIDTEVGSDALEGRKGASRKAGQGTRGGEEGRERSGIGGVPGGVRMGAPLVDREGLQELVDPSTRRMGGSLLGPSGTSAGNMEDGGNRARSGLNASGVVQVGVPRVNALSEIPAISTADGRVLDTVTISGKTSYPVDTADAVGALANGATVEQGAGRANAALNSTNRLTTGVEGTADVAGQAASTVRGGSDRANTGLAADGRVGLGVPRGHAISEIPAISSADGRVLDTVTISGKTSFPLDTADNVAALANGATVEQGAGRANVALNTSNRLITGVESTADLAGRTASTVRDEAIAGKGASDDLDVTPDFDRTLKRVVQMRDVVGSVDVNGADARLGKRLLDATDTAIRLPASEVNESAVRKWAAESGATVGAVAGSNLKSSSGDLLGDVHVITSQGKAADTTNVAGLAAGTVKARVGLAGQVWIKDPAAEISLISYDADTLNPGGVVIEWSGPGGGTFRFKDGGQILTFPAGSKAAVNPSTKYWVYYDADQNVIDVTTDKMAALADNRMILGEIITASDGSTTSTGGTGKEIL